MDLFMVLRPLLQLVYLFLERSQMPCSMKVKWLTKFMRPLLRFFRCVVWLTLRMDLCSMKVNIFTKFVGPLLKLFRCIVRCLRRSQHRLRLLLFS
jgi:hypothetical protein